jgi:hypothetical protein
MSFQAVTPNSEAAILARLISARDEIPAPEVAQYLLSFAFQPSDMERMRELAERAQAAELDTEEREELESCLRVSNLLAIMQSKARQFLRVHSQIR